MLSFIPSIQPLLGAEAPNGPILPGDINEVYWGSLAFFIVAGLLWWKALPAGKQMFIDRRERVVSEMDTAQQARANAEAALATVRTQLSGADSERTGLVDEARQTAVAIDQEGEERAARDAEQARLRAQRDIAASQQQALADLQSMVGSLAIGAAELVVRNNLDDGTQNDLIDSYIAGLSAN